MSHLLERRTGNRVLRINPPNANIHLGRWGSDWDWAVFCVMVASTIALVGWSTAIDRGRRTFHYLLAAVLAISSISYYSMASDLGATPITVEWRRNNPPGSGFDGYPTRQIWYARYIDWTLTTPMLLLSLLLMTGMPLSQIFITLFFNILMIVCGLLGALTRTRYKWGYYVFACAALFFVYYQLLVSGLRSARRLGTGFGRAFTTASAYLATIWSIYPICWALSEGGNVIGVSEEMIFYGILDLFSKPIFIFMLLPMLERCDYASLQLSSGKVSDTQAVVGSIHPAEKSSEVPSHSAAAAAPTAAPSGAAQPAV